MQAYVLESQILTHLSVLNEIKWCLSSLRVKSYTLVLCPYSFVIAQNVNGSHIKICLSSPQEAINQFLAEYTKELTPLA